MDDEAEAVPFKVWINEHYSAGPGFMRSENVTIKNGPQVFKSASLQTFGDDTTGEISHTTLRVDAYRREPEGPGYDFASPESRWSCNDEEIGRLRALLNREFPEQGQYVLDDGRASRTALIDDIESGEVDLDLIARLAKALASIPLASEAVANLNEAVLLSTVIERVRQQSIVSQLREAVENPSTTETQLQKLIQSEAWLFGGRYIRAADRRTFVAGEQLDIPLIRSDGALHVVELKQASIPRLVVEHRGHHVVGPEVNEAVGQALNYLRSLDEQRSFILSEFGVDALRASATVVIGHPMYVRGDLDEDAIVKAIRTYNAHLCRVEVITYADLVDGAERSLELSADPVEEVEEPAGEADLDGSTWGTSNWWPDEAPF